MLLILSAAQLTILFGNAGMSFCDGQGWVCFIGNMVLFCIFWWVLCVWFCFGFFLLFKSFRSVRKCTDGVTAAWGAVQVPGTSYSESSLFSGWLCHFFFYFSHQQYRLDCIEKEEQIASRYMKQVSKINSVNVNQRVLCIQRK